MSYKRGNRTQLSLLPECIDNYVGPNDPVRAYDAFVDVLDLAGLGIEVDEHRVGNSAYCPRTMLKVLVYSYSYGWRSSRKIERALHHNMSFIWLSGGLKPDHKTISNFRKQHVSALKQVLHQCARMCMQLNLIEGNVLFVDGSKIRANAGNSATRTKAALEQELKRLDERIDTIMRESQQADESEQGSLVEMSADLSNQQRLRSRMQQLVAEMDAGMQVNTTDPDCRIMKSRQGSHAAYNAQIVVDDAHGLIASADAVADVVDYRQLNRQVIQAEQNLGKPCEVACGDAGYSSVDALKPLVDGGRTVIVPNEKQAQNPPAEPTAFDKDKFRYDAASDTYTCPRGEQMYRSYQAKGTNKIVYRMKDYKRCLSCPHFGVCTVSKKGRTIVRLVNEQTQNTLIGCYEQPDNQQIYKRRKMKVELPFGHIKRNLAVSSFLVRGRSAVNAELSILATCFNITRMITLMGGVEVFASKLRAIKA